MLYACSGEEPVRLSKPVTQQEPVKENPPPTKPIKVGMSEAEVVKAMGKPKGRMMTKRDIILTYDRGTVTLNASSGKVYEIDLISVEQYDARSKKRQAAAESRAEADKRNRKRKSISEFFSSIGSFFWTEAPPEKPVTVAESNEPEMLKPGEMGADEKARLAAQRAQAESDAAIGRAARARRLSYESAQRRAQGAAYSHMQTSADRRDNMMKDVEKAREKALREHRSDQQRKQNMMRQINSHTSGYKAPPSDGRQLY